MSRSNYERTTKTDNEPLEFKCPPCQHGGKRTREGGKSGISRLERMKRGKGIKDHDDR
jgi:hypothetical protein